jgi:hypothetical protein
MWLAPGLPVALFVLTGCGAQAGGQTGEETDGRCVYAMSPLRLEEPSPLGFSAGELLALAGGEQSAAFGWLQTEGLRYGPESGVGEVVVRTSTAGAARFARVDSQTSFLACQDHVRIPVRVALATASAALDESFEADLTATTVDEATVTALVPSSELKGAFAFDPATLQGRHFTRLEVNLRFTQEGFAGYLLAGIESSEPAAGSVGFQPLPLACWGDIPSLHSAACGD